MHAHRLTATVFSLGAALAFGIPAMGADEVGEKHFMVSGNG